MSSRVLITVFLFISVPSLSLAAECNSNGQCRYGGRCGPNNQCYCSMNCDSWSFNLETLYCLPRKGARPEIFRNLCFLQQRACELQKDVPLIKFDYKKSPSHQCLAKHTKRWHLCPKPEDFMGPCGGTLTQNGNANEAGICLKDKITNRTRCECPQTRVGASCEEKVVFLSASSKVPVEGESTDYIGVSIGASIGAGVLIGILMFAIISKFRRRTLESSGVVEKRGGSVDEFADQENHQNKSNRTEIQRHFDTVSNEHYAITVPDRLTPLDSAAPQCSPKRQRLNGLSVVVRMPEDANNNHGVESAIEEEKETKDGKQERKKIFGGNSSTESTPVLTLNHTDTSKFCQGLPKRAYINTEAYTL